MDFTIYPLTITHVNWPKLIEASSSVLGINPTRGLDEHRIPLTKPSAFLSSLDFGNQPLKCLKNAGRRVMGNHFSMGFILVTDDIIPAFYISVQTDLSIRQEKGKDYILYIMTGTFSHWFEAINICSQETMAKKVRQVINEIHKHIEEAGFKDAWNNYTKIQAADGTTILRYNH